LRVPGRRTVLVLLVAATVLLGGGTWAVYGSPLLRATKVGVEGNRVLTVDQIERAARVPLGGALMSVDTGAVRRRLLKALPRIDRVSVERAWPHTVRVKVTERVAAAVVRTGRTYTEVDKQGVRFATVDRPPAGAPLLQLGPVQPASLRQFGADGLLQAAIAVAADLPEAVRKGARAIRVRSYDGITVELTGGREVMWGGPGQGARKAAVLTALMKARPGAVRYDVSAPTAPAASGS
jgi:cell division protein FtsQ